MYEIGFRIGYHLTAGGRDGSRSRTAKYAG